MLRQLYVQGELVGGLDIVKEMKHEGPLAPQLGVTPKVRLLLAVGFVRSLRHTPYALPLSEDTPRAAPWLGMARARNARAVQRCLAHVGGRFVSPPCVEVLARRVCMP